MPSVSAVTSSPARSTSPRKKRESYIWLLPLATQLKYSESLLQAEGRGLETLAVPEQLEDPDPASRRQRGAHLAQDGNDLILREAIEELAHPDQIVARRQTRPGSSRSMG